MTGPTSPRGHLAPAHRVASARKPLTSATAPSKSDRRGVQSAMDEAARRLRDIAARADKLGVRAADVASLRSAGRLLGLARREGREGRAGRAGRGLAALAGGVLCVTALLACQLELHSRRGFSRAWLTWHRLRLHDHMCTIDLPDYLVSFFRPPEACSMCRDVSQVDKISNISPQVFEKEYAYTGRPVVVTDAMSNWTAQQVFSFQFFKDVYKDHWQKQLGCQFFPYRTEFRNLYEVFNMSIERAFMHDGTKPWYIGWSNCDDQVARILRRHYDRPYFLPDTAENKKVDWIFMGSRGYGAQMHVDSVDLPSWQAQLKGRKKWILEPPPECYYDCQCLEVVVEPGEIIALDTNRWYHQTLIVSEEMSITIGAEYD
ncbi:uncharacterized protein LOC134528915 [Bacillus rossius redtenbacheri]|uniref:uncharacterized protein LOC134528915 n=1 Tax=Bacillus rossius redtenbacheri TaxID=93214 RepID=UPI002FDCF12A